MRSFVAAAMLLIPAASAAQDSAPAAVPMKCPIGGASFTFTPAPSNGAIGERPDGRPYGARTAPSPLPECPDNGLVLYKDYEPDEVAKLEPLVASEAYQGLRRGDTQYYRAYWLMKEMGLGPERYLWALLQASWEAEGKPELRARYLTELAEASAGVEAKPADLNWIGMEGRAINALRELGRFDDALARLDKLPLQSIEADTSAPKRRWAGYFKNLRTVIERKDASSEPFEMIPRPLALSRCVEQAATLAASARAFCETEAAAVAELRVKQANPEEELKMLSKSREASGR